MEPGYRIARLCIMCGLTQAQLAEKGAPSRPSIARLESGKQVPAIPFLHRVAEL
mgnify:CR=1 FL=1